MMPAVKSSHEDDVLCVHHRELRKILLKCFHDITFINHTRRGDYPKHLFQILVAFVGRVVVVNKKSIIYCIRRIKSPRDHELSWEWGAPLRFIHERGKIHILLRLFLQSIHQTLLMDQPKLPELNEFCAGRHTCHYLALALCYHDGDLQVANRFCNLQQTFEEDGFTDDENTIPSLHDGESDDDDL